MSQVTRTWGGGGVRIPPKNDDVIYEQSVINSQYLFQTYILNIYDVFVYISNTCILSVYYEQILRLRREAHRNPPSPDQTLWIIPDEIIENSSQPLQLIRIDRENS